MENVIRFFNWRKGDLEVLAHEAIAFKIFGILEHEIGTQDTHERSEILGEMIAAAKAVIDTEIRVFSTENKEEMNELLEIYRCLPNANSYLLNEIWIGATGKEFFLKGNNTIPPTKPKTFYHFSRKRDGVIFYWEFVGKSKTNFFQTTTQTAQIVCVFLCNFEKRLLCLTN